MSFLAGVPRALEPVVEKALDEARADWRQRQYDGAGPIGVCPCEVLAQAVLEAVERERWMGRTGDVPPKALERFLFELRQEVGGVE